MSAAWRLGSVVTRCNARLGEGAVDDDGDGDDRTSCCRTSSELLLFPPLRTWRLVARSLESSSGKYGTLSGSSSTTSA